MSVPASGWRCTCDCCRPRSRRSAWLSSSSWSARSSRRSATRSASSIFRRAYRASGRCGLRNDHRLDAQRDRRGLRAARDRVHGDLRRRSLDGGRGGGRHPRADARPPDRALASPVEKAAAVAVSVALVAVGTFVGLVVGVAVGGGGIGLAHMAALSLHLAFFGWAVGALALAVAASTGRRTLAAGTAAAFAVLGFLVNGFAPLVDAIAWLKYFSPFYYYEGHDPIGKESTPPILPSSPRPRWRSRWSRSSACGSEIYASSASLPRCRGTSIRLDKPRRLGTT